MQSAMNVAPGTSVRGILFEDAWQQADAIFAWLTAAEGRFCVNNPRGDENARHELTRRFAQQGHPLWSSLTRPSVV